MARATRRRQRMARRLSTSACGTCGGARSARRADDFRTRIGRRVIARQRRWSTARAVPAPCSSRRLKPSGWFRTQTASTCASTIVTCERRRWSSPRAVGRNAFASHGIAALPVRPVRGQLVQLFWSSTTPRPSRVVWGPGCYAVPWSDGSLLVGATVEEVGFDESTTAEGVRMLTDAAARMLPAARTATIRRGPRGPPSRDAGRTSGDRPVPVRATHRRRNRPLPQRHSPRAAHGRDRREVSRRGGERSGV